MARIFIIGSGVVGTATGRGFVKAGHHVTFIDVLPSRLGELSKEGFEARARIELPDESSFLFITLPTPHEGRRYDLSAFDKGVAAVGRALGASPTSHTVVVRSTVPPGTTEDRVLPALERESGLTCGDGFALASNPEFLRAASAAEDFRFPWMTVIASRSKRTQERLRELLSPFGGDLRVFDDPATAEFIKCAHNIYNATKISFWNEMWLVAQKLGIDHDAVASTVANSAEGSYNRDYGIRGGAPYGGVCLPKDTNGFLGFAEELGVEMPLLDAVVTVNEVLAAKTDQEIEIFLGRADRCSERPRRSLLINDFLWILLLAYFRPLFEMGLLLFGEWWFHTEFKEDRSRFERYVIQVTSVGKEIERVNEIVNEIRTYPMSMPYEIWVVIEPGFSTDYPNADRVIVVPKSFVAVSQYKCRALEYTRELRAEVGYGGDETKITFLDDDTSPTWQFLETAYAADYDICQGLTAPRVDYGTGGGFTHFLLSHIDDLRFHNCLTYCSTFQGVFNAPLFCHGEGMTITGKTEQQIGWNFRIFASEDLTFGCNAAYQGLKWGWFHEYIELTSPWTWGAYFKQRRRWMWGNIHAIVSRDVLPLRPAIRVGIRYILSLFTFLGSGVALVLTLSGHVHIHQVWFSLFWCSLTIWALNFAAAGWVNAGRRGVDQTRFDFWANRIWQTVCAVVLCPFTASFTVIALITTLYMGNPRAFEVIGKTKETADLETYSAVGELV